MGFPKLKKIKDILIICEGEEEFDYLSRLKSLNVFSKNFKLENAKSISNLSSKYNYHKEINDYKRIYVICDADDEPHKALKKALREIDRKNVFWINPCSLQLQILHFSSELIKNAEKSKNEKIINKVFDIKDYRATKEQRDKINNRINAENFNIMMQRLKKLSKNINDIPSTNILELFEKLL